MTQSLTTAQLETMLVTAARLALAASKSGYPPECYLHITEGAAKDKDRPPPVVESEPDIATTPHIQINDIAHF